MIIITKSLKNILQYCKIGKNNVLFSFYGCKACGYSNRLHRHGYYSRNVITLSGYYQVKVLRIKCPNPKCNKTFSVLPSFLIPYYQYSYNFIFFCLYFSYVLKFSYTHCIRIIKILNPDSSFTYSSISFYRKRLKINSAIINQFFARFDEFYIDMNNTSPDIILKKILLFKLNHEEFNFRYYTSMPYWFMADPMKKY